VTITASGVSPKQIEIGVGGRVTFVNMDRTVHEMSSDPHPTHENCPPINEVTALAPNQFRQTGVFTSARTCGYHDHGQFENASLQGTIVIR
jgi:plastocyanin